MTNNKDPSLRIWSLRDALGIIVPVASRKNWIIVLILVSLSGLMEGISALSIFSLINGIMSPSSLNTIPMVGSYLTELYDELGTDFITLISAVFLIAFLLRIGLGIWSTFMMYKAINLDSAKFACQLMERYIKAPLEYHLNRQSSELVRNTQISVNTIFRSMLLVFVTMASDALMGLAIIVIAVSASASTAVITVLVIGTSVWVLLKTTNRWFVKWGEIRQESAAKMIQSLQQSFNGIKEIKIHGREDFAIAEYKTIRDKLSRILYLADAVHSMPRFILEAIGVSAIIAVIIFVNMSSADLFEIMPILVLYSYSGFRLLPLAGRFASNINTFKYGIAAVDDIVEDWRATEPKVNLDAFHTDVELKFENTIHLDHVRYKYLNSKDYVLHDIDVTIKKGEYIAIVGPTGAGKSTMLDILLGLIKPSDGHVRADNHDIHVNVKSWHRSIGFVPQKVSLFDDTIAKNIAISDDVYDEQRLAKVIKAAHLEDVVKQSPNGLDTIIGEDGAKLSGGQRQRLAIARALYRDPSILVLDEATSSLDENTAKSITEAVYELQGSVTVIAVTHQIRTVQNYDRIIVLDQGRVSDSGTYNELLSRDTVFQNLLCDTANEQTEK